MGKKAACAGNWDKLLIWCSVWTVRRHVEEQQFYSLLHFWTKTAYSYPVHCWDFFPLPEYIKMSQTSWVSLLSRWASSCCTLCKQYCPHKMGPCCTLHACPNDFRGATHGIIPKELGAHALDMRQSNQCLCTTLQPLLFLCRGHKHPSQHSSSDRISTCMSCSSAWELLLLVRVTLHTPASYYLLIYNLMWNVGDQSESEVKCKPLKTAGQLEKYLSPMSLNGHVKRWPSAREGWWPNNSTALTFAFANAY